MLVKPNPNLNSLPDLVILVKNFSKDGLSDLLANLLYKILLRYTKDQIEENGVAEVFVKEVDKWTVKLQNNEILIDEYFDHIYLHVSKQINQILFSDQSELYASNINIIDSLKAIIEMVNQKYRCNLSVHLWVPITSCSGDILNFSLNCERKL